jgi:uncharacterized protein
MDTERNKRIVKATWDAFWSGEVDKGLENMSEDIIWQAPEGNAMGGPKRGKAEIRKFRFTELDVFLELRRTVVGIYGDGGTVVMELKAEGKLRNGEPYENAGCVVYDLENDKIVRVRQYVDTQKAMAINKLFQNGELRR